MARKERDCPKCGTETVVNDRNRRRRDCPNSDCNWWLYAVGSWSSPKRQEDFPVGSIGWESFED